MKRLLYLMLLVTLSSSIMAQQRRVKLVNNYIGFTAGVDYVFNPDGRKNAPGLGGVNGDLNFVYQLQHKHFLFLMGAGGNIYANHVQVPHFQQGWEQITDTDGDRCNLYFDFNENISRTREFAVSAPILMGAQWGGIYFMAGVKMRIKVWSETINSSTYSLSAQYPFYNSLLHDMPEHYLISNIESKNTEKNTTMRFLGAVTGEVGVDIGHYLGNRDIIKLGVYVDYTPSFHKASEIPFVSNEYIGTSTEAMYRSEQIPSQWLHYEQDHSILSQIGVGLKLTVLFKMKQVIPICNCEGFYFD